MVLSEFFSPTAGSDSVGFSAALCTRTHRSDPRHVYREEIGENVNGGTVSSSPGATAAVDLLARLVYKVLLDHRMRDPHIAVTQTLLKEGGLALLSLVMCIRIGKRITERKTMQEKFSRSRLFQ